MSCLSLTELPQAEREAISLEREIEKLAAAMGDPIALFGNPPKKADVEAQVRTHGERLGLSAFAIMHGVGVAVAVLRNGASPAIAVMEGNHILDRIAAERSPVPPRAA